jgi:hypothetical protein
MSDDDNRRFREIACGMFQAEGSLGARFRSTASAATGVAMSLSQNVSDASILFFAHLHIALSKSGVFRVTENQSGKLHITYISES